jgi:hypothetical protein
VDELGWKGKLDHNLFRDAASRGFDGLIVLDVDQLADPDLCRALKASGLHHISLRQGRRVKGKAGVARVIASIIGAMPYVLADLEESLDSALSRSRSSPRAHATRHLIPAVTATGSSTA